MSDDWKSDLQRTKPLPEEEDRVRTVRVDRETHASLLMLRDTLRRPMTEILKALVKNAVEDL